MTQPTVGSLPTSAKAKLSDLKIDTEEELAEEAEEFGDFTEGSVAAPTSP